MAESTTPAPTRTSPQTTNHILMVRPACFGFNADTAASNAFQTDDGSMTAAQIADAAREEFDNAVAELLKHGVDVFVVEDNEEPAKPDAVFPNNWISFHADGTIVTYPMMSERRRQEIRPEILESIAVYFRVEETWAMNQEIEDGKFLEGTGSLVLDRQNRLAYACRSNRTDEALLNQFCERMQYRPVLFDSKDEAGLPIYHTNVVMAVTEKFVVLCLESICDAKQRDEIQQLITMTGKHLIKLTFDQVQKFAGNMLQVRGENNERLLIMSQSAYDSLEPSQKDNLESESTLVPLAIPVIEKYGGGSLRCMLAEIFLPIRPDDDSDDSVEEN